VYGEGKSATPPVFCENRECLERERGPRGTSDECDACYQQCSKVWTRMALTSKAFCLTDRLKAECELRLVSIRCFSCRIL
jgi:hypothetical protein